MNQQEWIEYFTLVYGRKPSIPEMAQAAKNGEFTMVAKSEPSQTQQPLSQDKTIEQPQVQPEPIEKQDPVVEPVSPVQAEANSVANETPATPVQQLSETTSMPADHLSGSSVEETMPAQEQEAISEESPVAPQVSQDSSAEVTYADVTEAYQPQPSAETFQPSQPQPEQVAQSFAQPVSAEPSQAATNTFQTPAQATTSKPEETGSGQTLASTIAMMVLAYIPIFFLTWYEIGLVFPTLNLLIQGILVFFLAIISSVVYFLPTILSTAKNKWILFIVNFLTAWTLIGWIVLLVLAIRNNNPQPAQPVSANPASGYTQESPSTSLNISQAAVDATNSVAQELMKLQALKNQGVLTEEEFQAQKAKILGN